MIQQWRTALLARELERIAEHQPKGELCRGCSKVGYPESWPCITVEVADQTVRNLRRKLAGQRVSWDG